jgi:hypothetical protein
MAGADFGAARRGKVAIAIVLAGVCVMAESGCGRREPASVAEPAGVSQDASGGRNSAAGGGTGSPVRPGGFQLLVVPVTPNRSVAPTVSLRSAPGRDAEIVAVQWFVNGVEQGTSPRLEASRFRKGDRIRAEATLRSEGRELAVTSAEVVAGNALPAVEDVRIDPAAPVSGATVTAVVQAQDPDGDPLKFRYQWYADNVPVAGGGATMTLRGVKRGAWVHVTVTPNDGTGDGAWRDSARYQVVNALPVVKSALPQALPPTRDFAYPIVAEDADGDPLTYVLVKAPPGMILTGNTLEWKVPDEYIGKPVEAVVRISDDHGGQTVQNISMTIQPPR